MKSCNPKPGKSFLDIYAFLNKSLASHPETIHSLELELHQIDSNFSLTILSKEEWNFPQKHPIFTQAINHTIFVREDLYIKAIKNNSTATLLLVHEYINYLYQTDNYKNFI